MDEKRRKATGGVALYGNVIALDAYRRRPMAHAPRQVLYVTERGKWIDHLAAVPSLQITVVASLEALQARVASVDGNDAPDVIVVEAAIRWASPIELIADLHRRLEVPMVLLYGPSDLRRDPGLLKNAFAEGAHDTLRTPVQTEELQEALDILLKLGRKKQKTP